MENIEIWKDIEGYDGIYQVSSLGRIKSLKFGKYKILSLSKNNRGYVSIGIKYNKKHKTYRIHRLVASVFHGLDLRNPKQIACHKNDICDDNRECNIFVGSLKDNTQDMLKKRRDNLFGKPSRIILQFTKQGEFIKEWNSMSDIFRELGILQSNINRCCNGITRVAKGFVWKYR